MPFAHKKLASVAIAALFTLAAAQAQALEMREMVEKTILTNPEVRFRAHEFRSSVEETGLGRAGYMPTVDLGYNTGRENNKEPLINNGPQIASDFNRHSWSANLTQNLFQGFQTLNTVNQLEAGKRGKYFELLDASEQMALEATRTYLDMLRYRQLLELAKNNYGSHKSIYNQLEKKVKAGVGRGVDLEQAAGRLALADTNMINESSNLHDVSARYARLLGEEPPATLAPAPSLRDKLPQDKDLLATAVRNSPSYLAALENLTAAKSDVAVKKGAFSPTLDLHARKEQGDNLSGTLGRHDRQMLELTLNFNLFRGAADKARLGMAAERYNSALDLSDKACRDVQQNVRIASNDAHKLNDQMAYLQQHVLSTKKALEAYKKQFIIGQRSLLDVLDSENELFDARRAQTNAEYDAKLAQARVLASSGLLLSSLQLKPLEENSFESSAGDEERNACSTQYTPPAPLDKSSIDATAYDSDSDVPESAPVQTPAKTKTKPKTSSKAVKS